MTLKVCAKCGEEKPSSCFYLDNSRRSKRNPYCKACEKQRRSLQTGSKEYATGYHRTIRGRFSAAKGGAKYRGLDWTLSLEDFEKVISTSCHYCNKALPEAGSGLDRVDNVRGYTLDNVVACCTDCNRIKGICLSYQEMVAVAALLKTLRTGNAYGN